MVEPDQQFRVREGTINYGPSREREYIQAHEGIDDGLVTDASAWMLGLTTEEGERLELDVDEETMYELWVEVQNVPWPRDDTDKGDLRREVVEHTGGMSPEQLREVLGIIKAVEHGIGWSR